jgi:tricorn protease
MLGRERLLYRNGSDRAAPKRADGGLGLTPYRFVLWFLGLVLAVAAGSSAALGAPGSPPLLLRDPTISRTTIAFAYGGDIWTVPRDGGAAQRLVTGYALDSGPLLSPDGSLVAFSGKYDGNIDVYVVPVTGGEPRRLTYHPGPDRAVGWTPDGKRVLFRSERASPTDPNRLFTVPVAGGFPAELPLDMAEQGSYSPDGTHLAYVPNFRWEPFWQGYRGGQTTQVNIADLADSRTVTIPRPNSNDNDPMWIGKTVYFLSDRDGPVTLFSYDTQTHRVVRELPSRGFDITSASAGDGAIVYARFDELHVYDPATHRDQRVEVRVAGDLEQVRPHWEKVAQDDDDSNSGDDASIENAAVSPTGVRAVFEAHGAILTVPAEHGDIRNVSDAPNTENRDPAWSPDGKSIAFFSDRSGEYKLYIRDQRGLDKARAIDLGNSPSFYYSPVWSPDSKKIAYTDKRLNLWYVDLGHPTPVKVATAPYGGFGPGDFEPSWSPDSRLLAYCAELENFLHAVSVYSTLDRRSHQITDGMSDSRSPVFDASGKYLYFTSSTNTGLTSAGLDMTSDQHPVSSNVYAAVLRRDTPSPVALQTGDEEAKTPPSPAPKADGANPPTVTIDYDGLLQRIVALPIPNANYVGLFAGKTGQLYVLSQPLTTVSPQPPPTTVSAFDLMSRQVKVIAAGVEAFTPTADGEKGLFEQHGRWIIGDLDKPLDGSAKTLDTGGMAVYVDPHAEWRQMYHEVWRIERDFFYDPHYHGLDLAAAERRFEPYLPGIASRDDLTFLFEEMLSYLSVGHMFVRGGTQSPVPLPTVTVGLLGADYRIENDRYRFAKIFNGENWNPDVSAPLTQPGTNVRTGDYLIAVNGRQLHATDNIYAFFENTARKQTTISVGSKPDGSDARDVTVVPVGSEFALRNLDWIEHNRHEVDRLSGGKLAYVYMPDTEYDGFTNFNRYYFAQVGKAGVILDERFNHGGQLADYVIDYLKREPRAILAPRDGRLIVDPPLAIYGPKVMIINQYAGSGGDALPWLFRKAHLGPLVGVRTWGGLVGIGGYPTLLDGGTVTAPRTAIGGLHGQWEVEGVGIAPDIEVRQDPHAVRDGHDPQLEAAVAEALKLLREHPLPTYRRPPYPDHHPVLPPGP